MRRGMGSRARVNELISFCWFDPILAWRCIQYATCVSYMPASMLLCMLLSTLDLLKLNVHTTLVQDP